MNSSNNSYVILQALIISAIAWILLRNLRPWHIPFYCRFDIEETRPGCPLG